MVTAKDGASDPRIGTASVTVSVKDIEDEIPVFHKTIYEAKVPENAPDFLVTQVHVSIVTDLFYNSLLCLNCNVNGKHIG